MKATKSLLLLSIFYTVILSFVMPAFAYQWKSTTSNPTPTAYNGFQGLSREYFYEQQTRFYVNETGFNQGISGAKFVGEMWGSVFANPSVQDSGLTAITNFDINNPANATDYPGIEQNFLEAFDFNSGNFSPPWLVSPYWNSTTNPGDVFLSSQSGLDWDVPLHMWVNPSSGTTTSPNGDTALTPPSSLYTIGGSGTQNPYPLFVGLPGDVGSGYMPDGSVAYWQAAGSTTDYGDAGGWSNMSEDGAITTFNDYGTPPGSGEGTKTNGASTGNVIVSYPFTSDLEAIDLTSGTVTATALNPTPYDIIGENWYAYVVTPNNVGSYTGTPTLLTQGTVSIGAQPLGNTTPNQSQFTFSVPASDAGDELIVTLNETLNPNQSVNPDGLPVYYAYGPLSNTETLADNSPKDQIVPLNVWNVTSQGTAFDPSGTPIAYSDNAQSLILPGSSGGGTQPTLVVTPSTANVLVGNTQQYTDTYFPNGQAAGNGQNVTQSSNWYSGDVGIATVIVTGSSGGLATGNASGTTSIQAQYDGLSASAQINVAAGVAPSGYNLTVENLESGLSGGTATPGDSYTMTATFVTNTPFTVNGANVWWYINSGSGWQSINSVAQPVTIPANSSTVASAQWMFPASASSVQLMVTVDDPYANGSFQPEPIAGTTSMETTYSDNYVQTGVGSSVAPTPQPGSIYRSVGTVTMPVTITPPPVTVEVPHTTWVTTWTPIPINNTLKNETWGPPHFYLSY